jgi:hypothetical protein
MSAMMQDLKYGLRMLIKNPGEPPWLCAASRRLLHTTPAARIACPHKPQRAQSHMGNYRLKGRMWLFHLSRGRYASRGLRRRIFLE